MSRTRPLAATSTRGTTTRYVPADEHHLETTFRPNPSVSLCPQLMWRNGFEAGDKRKPTTDLFQQYWLDVYCPAIFTLLYGKEGWAEIRSQTVKFK